MRERRGWHDRLRLRARRRVIIGPIMTVNTVLPDRLCVDPASKYYDETVLSRDIGVRFNGVEHNNVHEYCISEGWVRLTIGNTVDRRGRPLTVKRQGAVEPYFK